MFFPGVLEPLFVPLPVLEIRLCQFLVFLFQLLVLFVKLLDDTPLTLNLSLLLCFELSNAVLKQLLLVFHDLDLFLVQLFSLDYLQFQQLL